jgi:nitroimidazol reductase NimA-like FMN-containing flavoprotein (pyridoxamine 5'-phosphate oxidase superfamily)
MNEFTPTLRTTVARHPERAVYEREEIYSILDEAYICHVGYSIGHQPFVIPMVYSRWEDRLVFHGSALSRTLNTVAQGIDVCVTVTLVDGFVLARSAFRNSLNYRSVVALGKAFPVTNTVEKLEALRRLTNHIVPGRWEEVRPPNEAEMTATSVLALPLNEVSAKSRSGFPLDLESDLSSAVWAGVVPVRLEFGDPVPDIHLPVGTPVFDRDTLKRRPQSRP